MTQRASVLLHVTSWHVAGWFELVVLGVQSQQESKPHVHASFKFLSVLYIYLKILFICFLRERKGGRKKGRETWIGCFSHTPNGGPGPQPRHVPWLGIKPETFWFSGQHSTRWATPVRAYYVFKYLFDQSKSHGLSPLWTQFLVGAICKVTLQRHGLKEERGGKRRGYCKNTSQGLRLTQGVEKSSEWQWY